MNKETIIIRNDISELEKIVQKLEFIEEKWELSPKIIFNLNLALEELISNIIFYGFDDDDEHEINISFEKEKTLIKILISDEGKEFNPFNVSVEEELDKSVEEREIGGLGIHFVKKLMDSFEYNRVNKINNITLIKNIN